MNMKSLIVGGIMALAASVANAATVSQGGTQVGGTNFVSDGGGALVSSFVSSYAANTADSVWVWDADLAKTPVTFTYTFDLTGFQIGTASLSGKWGVDNTGIAKLNGVKISEIFFGSGAFTSLTNYGPVTSGFLAGVNILTFEVANCLDTNVSSACVDNISRNPAAFRAEVLVEASPVPLPAGGLLLITALGGVAALRRRRKAA